MRRTSEMLYWWPQIWGMSRFSSNHDIGSIYPEKWKFIKYYLSFEGLCHILREFDSVREPNQIPRSLLMFYLHFTSADLPAQMAQSPASTLLFF